MTLPKHSPVLPLRHGDTYSQNIRCYGKPPKGYRWLKVGDKTSSKTLLVTPWYFNAYPYGKTVKIDKWPAIEPIAKPVKAKPETVGDLRRDALVLEVVKRTATNVTFRIVKQRDSDVEFRAENGLVLRTVDYPAVYSNSFYLRGGMTKRNRDLLSCDVKKFGRITDAVNEYNESRPKIAPKPVAPTPLAQIKTILLANPKIAADVMRECIQVIADRN